MPFARQKSLTGAALVFAVGGIVGTSEATLRRYESFAYTPGQNLKGQVDLAPNTATWGAASTNSGLANDLVTDATDLLYPGLLQDLDGSVTGGGAGIQPRIAVGGGGYFNDASAPVDVYFSYLVRVDDLSGTTSGALLNDGGLISGLNNGVGDQTGTMSTYGAAIFARTDGLGGFNFGILEQGVDGTQATYESTQRTLGETYLIVGHYQINGAVNTGGGTPTTDDSARFWVNPVSLGGADPGGSITGLAVRTDIPTPSANPANATVQSFSFRQQGTGGQPSPAVYYVDDLRIGDTYADVTPVPEPATLTVLGLTGAALLTRRRQNFSTL